MAIDPAELTAAIHRVADGDAVSRGGWLAGFALDAFTLERAPQDAELDQLTAREQAIMLLIARGYRHEEIATRRCFV